MVAFPMLKLSGLNIYLVSCLPSLYKRFLGAPTNRTVVAGISLPFHSTTLDALSKTRHITKFFLIYVASSAAYFAAPVSEEFQLHESV